MQITLTPINKDRRNGDIFNYFYGLLHFKFDKIN